MLIGIILPEIFNSYTGFPSLISKAKRFLEVETMILDPKVGI